MHPPGSGPKNNPLDTARGDGQSSADRQGGEAPCMT